MDLRISSSSGHNTLNPPETYIIRFANNSNANGSSSSDHDDSSNVARKLGSIYLSVWLAGWGSAQWWFFHDGLSLPIETCIQIYRAACKYRRMYT